jgi:hypothetical protein
MANVFDKIKKYISSPSEDPGMAAKKQEVLAQLMRLEAEVSDLENTLEAARAAKNTEDIKQISALLKEKKSTQFETLNTSLSLFPDMQKYASELAKTKEVSSNISNIVSGILDAAEANQQIKAGQRAQRNVKPFESLQPFKRSNLLQEQIRNTKQANTAGALEQATGGLKSQIENQYGDDVSKAATMSGGQSGAFMANSQAAARSRIQNMIQLQAQQAAFRNQNDRNLNYLATQEIGENQAADVSNRFRAGQDWDRYRFETENAAGLEQAGRKNMRSSRNYMMRQIPGLMTMGMQPKVYGNATNTFNSTANVTQQDKIPLMDFNNDEALLQIDNYLSNPSRWKYNQTGR